MTAIKSGKATRKLYTMQKSIKQAAKVINGLRYVFWGMVNSHVKNAVAKDKK
ncbi:MAG: hypothetical protein IJ297_02850 [Clostridia bacterium]|nr:hypothetical protein [Clostridia bacterium]